MDDLEPPSASDCPFEEGTALHRDWCRRHDNDLTGFPFDDEERANRAKALRPNPKDRD